MNGFAYILESDKKDISLHSADSSAASNSFLQMLNCLFASFRGPRIEGRILENGGGLFVSCPKDEENSVFSATRKQKLHQALRYVKRKGISLVGLEKQLPYNFLRELSLQYNLVLTDGFVFRLLYGWEGIKQILLSRGLEPDEVEVCFAGCFNFYGELILKTLIPDLRFVTLIEKNKEQAAQVGEKILKETGIAVKLTTNPYFSHRMSIILLLEGKDDLESWCLAPNTICWDLTGNRSNNFNGIIEQGVKVFTQVNVELPFHIYHPKFAGNVSQVDASLAEVVFLAQSLVGERVGITSQIKVEDLYSIYKESRKLGYRFGSFKVYSQSNEWRRASAGSL